MKRTAAGALCAILACASFSSCMETDVPSPDTVTLPEDTYEEKQDEQKQNNDSAPVFHIDGELPDIGVFSGKPERFYSEYTPYFIPSDKYGKIVPFVGSYKTFGNGNEGFRFETGSASYGFCTEDGKLIMDADKRNSRIYSTVTRNGATVYTLNITDAASPSANSGSASYGYNEALPQKTLIIPESGEWCIELDANTWPIETDDDIICVSSYSQEEDKTEFIFYDHSGREISRTSEYDSITRSSCGLYAVTRWDADDPFSGFIDEAGNIVLGPYVSVEPFNSFGIATVEEEDGRYLIDTEGNKLCDRPYEIILEQKNEYDSDPAILSARHKNDPKKHDIFSPDGKFITTVEGPTYFSFAFPKDGEPLYYYTETYDKMVWKRLSDHSEFISEETGCSPNVYSPSDDVFVYFDDSDRNTERTAYFHGADGKVILTVNDYKDIIAVSDNARYIIYSRTADANGNDKVAGSSPASIETSVYIYDTEEKTTDLLYIGDGTVSFCGRDNEYLIASYSDTPTVFGAFGNSLLYSLSDKKKMFDGSKNISFMQTGSGGYFTVCTESTCTLYDCDLNMILKTFNE